MCAYFWVLPIIPVHAEQDYSPQEKRYSELHGVLSPRVQYVVFLNTNVVQIECDRQISVYLL